MSDIQKAIDEFSHEFLTTTTADNRLKSLLKQVAEKAFTAGMNDEYKALIAKLRDENYQDPNFYLWWEEQDLTFNKDSHEASN